MRGALASAPALIGTSVAAPAGFLYLPEVRATLYPTPPRPRILFTCIVNERPIDWR